MAALSPTAPARARPSARPAPRARPAPARRRAAADGPAIVGGVLWIVVLAALLAGVVAINVALLQLNVRLDALSQERAKLRSANAALAAELSSASDPFELETLARDQLGFTRATPDQMLYVDIGAR